MGLKIIPEKLTKHKMLDLYKNDFNDRFILSELCAIQERFGINKRVRILSQKVKNEFFKLHGLPTGYVLENK